VGFAGVDLKANSAQQNNATLVQSPIITLGLVFLPVHGVIQREAGVPNKSVLPCVN